MEDKKKLLFIFNPFSGKGLIKNKIADILDIMVKANYEVTVHPTQGRGDATMLTEQEAKNFDLVVCSGGDGTLDETVTGMMKLEQENRIPIGYIPAGSTNDFGNSLGIPKDPLASAKIAVEGNRFPCDIGYFNGDSFVYVAAFGIFTDVSYETSQELKNAIGHAAYLIEGIKKLIDIPSYTMQIEVNGQVIIDRFIFGMITNSASIGGFKDITGKNIEYNDGLFEVTLIKEPKNPMELNEIVAGLTNLISDSNMIYTFKTEEIKITSKEMVSWTLDGEYGGDSDEVRIRCEKEAVEIMI